MNRDCKTNGGPNLVNLSGTKLEVRGEEERIAALIRECPNVRIIRQIHAHVLVRALPMSSLSFSLSKLLAFCSLSPLGDINYAQRLLTQIPYPSIFSYNSLIRGLCQTHVSSLEPIFIFKELIRNGRAKPNSFTLSFVLKGCSILLAFEEGRQVHSHAIRSGFYSSPFVLTSLVNFYGKCEKIDVARELFDEMPERNLVAWSAMITGYAKLGMFNDALGLFREMQKVGVVPDEVTMASVISACASAGALEVGKWFHTYVDRKLNVNDLELSTSLINMYAKCGCVERAREVFDAMPEKDAKAWSSMIIGYAIHGQAVDALEVFAMMEKAKVKPNDVAYVGVLLACAHGGFASGGQRFWSTMIESGFEPSMEHYACMVDLLCRADQIEEAYEFVEKMPFYPNAVIWRTLLVGCKKKKLFERGERTAHKLLQLEPSNAENYLLLSGLYASCFKWKKMSQIRKLMKEKGIKAVPGCSSIEADGILHEFVLGGWSNHPEAKEIRTLLNEISQRVRYSGHEPWVSSVLHHVGVDAKGDALWEHSERIAIAFGLLKTKAPVVIRVVKNLRVCSDCHKVTKIVSNVYGREIVVRDRVRFHKFVDGSCSCGDFW